MQTAPVWSGRNAGTIDFCVCDDLPTLVWLAKLADLELHPSLSLAEDDRAARRCSSSTSTPARRPTIVECCRVALRLRELFGDLGLECFPKTSGSKGLQVYVPLNTDDVTYERDEAVRPAPSPSCSSAETRTLVVSQHDEGAAQGQGPRRLEPERRAQDDGLRLLAARAASARRSRRRVELGGGRAALEREDPDSLSFEAADVLERVEKHGDLFAPVLELKQKLPDLEQAVR